MCYFSRFKRDLQRYRNLPSTSWSLYTAGFGGRKALALKYKEERDAANLVERKGRELGRKAGPFDCEAKGLMAMEGCPFYLGEAHAPRALRQTFPSLKAVAVIRSPRERTISAFNDYVRMGRIGSKGKTGTDSSSSGMESLVLQKVGQMQSGEKGLEDFDMRILTSGVYIYGLRYWGKDFPSSQLKVIRAEDMFDDAANAMRQVQSFLGLRQPFEAAMLVQRNVNTMKSKAEPSRKLNQALDGEHAKYVAAHAACQPLCRARPLRA